MFTGIRGRIDSYAGLLMLDLELSWTVGGWVGLGDSLGGRWLCLLDAWVGSCEFVMVWMVVLGRDVLLMYG